MQTLAAQHVSFQIKIHSHPKIQCVSQNECACVTTSFEVIIGCSGPQCVWFMSSHVFSCVFVSTCVILDENPLEPEKQCVRRNEHACVTGSFEVIIGCRGPYCVWFMSSHVFSCVFMSCDKNFPLISFLPRVACRIFLNFQFYPGYPGRCRIYPPGLRTNNVPGTLFSLQSCHNYDSTPGRSF